MKTTYTTAAEAIEASIRDNEITYATSDCMDDLRIECEDCVESKYGENEYWGTTESGSEWRVHVELSDAE